eukprot:scaffold22839_cov171-Amphora_coffeaeformis.AAC.6
MMTSVQRSWKRTQAMVPSQTKLALRRLVTQLSPTTSLLRSEQRDNEVYLIGTAHVSQKSATEVIDLIELVQPQSVFIELDPVRAAKLWQDQHYQDSMERQLQQAAGTITRHLPAQVLLGNNEQKVAEYITAFYRMLKKYGLVPGIDMLAGMRAGKQLGANLVYGDQDGNETIRKLTATLHPSMILRAMTTPMPASLQSTMYETLQSLSSSHQGNAWENLGDRVEDMKTRQHAHEMTDWLTRAFPDAAHVLIGERDTIMAHNLLRHCASGRVVAVVGMAHMDGIEREWSRIDQKDK